MNTYDASIKELNIGYYWPYFEYEGKLYKTGTILYITFNGKPHTKATFIHFYSLMRTYLLKINGNTYKFARHKFLEYLEKITDELDPEVKQPVVRQKLDTDIPGMGAAWMLYIAAMIGALIFVDRVWIWVFGSIYFFTWRANTIKKVGMYIEW